MGNDTPNPSPAPQPPSAKPARRRRSARGGTPPGAAPSFPALVEALANLTRADAGAIPTRPPHPDAKLLVVAYHLFEVATQAHNITMEMVQMGPSELRSVRYREFMALHDNFRGLVDRVCVAAKTPAGVYAKAALLRATHWEATSIGQSLADDLMNQPGLRAALWPADLARGVSA